MKNNVYFALILKLNMTDKMLKFVKIGQQTPPKREVKERKEDFNEIYDDFLKKKAQEQEREKLQGRKA